MDYPSKLSYSWQFAEPAAEEREAHSRVTFTLERLDVGTRLRFVHDQFEAGSKTLETVSRGWPQVMCGLKTLLESGTAIDFSMAVTEEQLAVANG